MMTDQTLLDKIERILLEWGSLKGYDVHLRSDTKSTREWFERWCKIFDDLENNEFWQDNRTMFKNSQYVPLWLQVAAAAGRTHVARLLLEDYGPGVENLSVKQQMALFYLNLK